MLHVVSYYLGNPAHDHAGFQAALQRLGDTRLQILPNVMLVHSDTDDAAAIQRALQPYVGAMDRVFVAEMARRPANGWMTRDVWVWTQANNR